MEFELSSDFGAYLKLGASEPNNERYLPSLSPAGGWLKGCFGLNQDNLYDTPTPSETLFTNCSKNGTYRIFATYDSNAEGNVPVSGNLTVRAAN